MKMGQAAMKSLFKEPIKEAVKETLAEEGLTSTKTVVAPDTSGTDQEVAVHTIDEDLSSESSDSGSSILSPKVVIPAVTLLGIAVALRQLGEGSLEPQKIPDMMGQETEPPMEEDMSKSAPGEQRTANVPDDDAEEVNL